MEDKLHELDKQVATNTKALDLFSENQKKIFDLHALQAERLNSIDITLMQIKTTQESEKEHRTKLDKKFTTHIDDGTKRLSDIEKNSSFRGGCKWVIGIIFMLLLVLLRKVFT